jgi:S-(hydroxymethyl)glutathione dehydrogenase/alcohol dehydrogenase
MSLDRAAILGCAVHTGIGAVRHSAAVKRGDRVAVIGCGGVGLNVVQGARLSSARAIVGIDVQSGNLQKARVMGATNTVDASGEGLIEAVIDATDGGADHVFDVVGRESTLVQAFAMTRPGGTVTMVGLPDPGSRVTMSVEDLFAEKRLQGHKMGRGFREDIAWYCSLYSSGDLFLDELISGSVPLDCVNEALSSMDGATGRTLIAFDA